MPIRTELPVSIQSRNFRDLPQTTGHITKIEFDKGDRTKNAMRFIGMGMAATFCAVFVPIAHWFLVPLLFVASWVFGLDKLKEMARSEGGKGPCPKCHKEFPIEPSTYKERITDTCSYCHEDVEILFPQPAKTEG
ncbi:MAG: hypothetical protein JST80_10975 [Bdellovibrionales bacterium]|nr:hypothetical protein [Bdellovibrionales bacterium]